MNILTFNYEYPPLGGGGGVAHELIATELAGRHRLVVITSAFDDLPGREISDGVEIHRVPVVGRRDRIARLAPVPLELSALRVDGRLEAAPSPSGGIGIPNAVSATFGRLCLGCRRVKDVVKGG